MALLSLTMQNKQCRFSTELTRLKLFKLLPILIRGGQHSSVCLFAQLFKKNCFLNKLQTYLNAVIHITEAPSHILILASQAQARL